MKSERPSSSGGAPTSRSTLSSSSWYSGSRSRAACSRDDRLPSPPRSASRCARRSAWRCFERCRFWATGGLAGLAVPRVPAAPAAVLAHLDPVGIVALGLLGLVVAPLAVVACKRHGDSNVSPGHGSSVGLEERRGPGGKKTPPGSAGSRRV